MVSPVGLNTTSWFDHGSGSKKGGWVDATDTVAISNTSGTVSDGNSLVITCTGAGTKATAAPFVFDDFEAGTLGNEITDSTGISKTWVRYTGGTGTTCPLYNDADSHSGTQCARRVGDLGSDWNGAGMHGLDSNEIYLTGWLKWDHTAGTFAATPQAKYYRINSFPDGDLYNATSSSPSLALGSQPTAIANVPFGGCTTTELLSNYSLAEFAEDTWARFEIHAKLGNPGESDGFARMYFNGAVTDVLPSGITRAISQSVRKFDNFMLAGMADSGAPADSIDYYNDDFYVDTTPARVEISLSSTWAATTSDKEVQIPTAWATDEVTVTLRGLTALGAGTKYLYIINKDGDVNANGYAL